MMKTIQLTAYICVIVAVLVHHIPVLRAALEVATDAHYYEISKDIGLWEEQDMITDSFDPTKKPHPVWIADRSRA